MARARWFGLGFVIAGLTVASAASTRAAAPAVDYLYPAGGQQGTTVQITTGSAKGDAKIDPWPASVSTDAPGVTFKPGEANGTLVADIAKDAAVGPHLVRIYNADGTSAPRVFVVGHRPEELERETTKEPNDDARAAQSVARLPAVLNGRLEKSGDVDSWAADVEVGRWLVAEVTCRRLGSPVDPSIRLLDPDGTVVAFSHDTFGLDPLLAYRAPRAGRYVLQVAGFAHPPNAEVRFAGSKANVYRLLVTSGPYARYALPAVVARNAPLPVRLFGWNLGDDGDGFAAEVDPTLTLPTADQIVLSDPRLDNAPCLALADRPGKPEREPNDAASAAQPLETPAAIDGRLDPPGDVDRFTVTAKKGESLTIAVQAAALGSPIDPVLTVADAGGKELARGDDDPSAGRDAQLQWSAPADGTYIVALADLTRSGGAECVYRLDIAGLGAVSRVTVDADSYRVAPGKSVDVKVAVPRRPGDDAPLSVSVTGLPEGVTATTPDVPAKGAAVTVTLKAAPDAAAVNRPFRITVVSKDEKHTAERTAVFSLGPDLLVENTATLWLTVTPADQRPATPAGSSASRPAR